MSHVLCIYINALFIGHIIENNLNVHNKMLDIKSMDYYIYIGINEEKSLVHGKMCVTYS